MAAFKGMSLRKCTLAFAMVCLVFLSMEVAKAQADDDNCNKGQILSSLSSCLSLSSIPSPGSPCCDAFVNVHNNIKPSGDCICQIAKLNYLGSVNLSAGEIKAVITSCVGASAAPACLG